MREKISVKNTFIQIKYEEAEQPRAKKRSDSADGRLELNEDIEKSGPASDQAQQADTVCDTEVGAGTTRSVTEGPEGLGNMEVMLPQHQQQTPLLVYFLMPVQAVWFLAQQIRTPPSCRQGLAAIGLRRTRGPGPDDTDDHLCVPDQFRGQFPWRPQLQRHRSYILAPVSMLPAIEAVQQDVIRNAGSRDEKKVGLKQRTMMGGTLDELVNIVYNRN
ncbi:unnamed protein product [Effrenium voratum]|uniref:Uncharacterized protein n=1 Tax=Effrenium voratum TaxID=2562239 RepID=A0AA36HKE5_9DINO|nr:unnamed protein product [Effrenium voratum]CAJ1434138.1 unnamed protein product [Effrenium voratum]